MNRSIVSVISSALWMSIALLSGCGGVRECRVEQMPTVSYDRNFEEDVSLKISTQDVYEHSLGLYTYRIFLKEGMEKQYRHCLDQCFGNVSSEATEINLSITVMDTSIFPIAGYIYDVRLFLKIEILNRQMAREKTVMVYGFGSDESPNRALEKAITNSFYQLLPSLEELFVRE